MSILNLSFFIFIIIIIIFYHDTLEQRYAIEPLNDSNLENHLYLNTFKPTIFSFFLFFYFYLFSLPSLHTNAKGLVSRVLEL